MKSSFCLLVLLGIASVTTHAQTTTTTKTTVTQTTPATDEDLQKHFLNETIDLSKARAEELPDLFDHFISVVREERRGWNYRQWTEAEQVLGRLVARYQVVHSGLPLEERVRIRAAQTEFKTLKSTRTR
ncbi:hypothetical protein Q5H93_13895 [Hymenobacter sp. ASUV-10]|uniref:Uncharacterized protein n=1 Tax=Hymenobacter aranciens TaxID=3063996 RepID=A0ABT9BDH4_9BACT|nr:hypothetical protein [Hymenobacter sp. ASUV-10]MDO7875830.1 hypothetical protein [Hymenobacter sp. ASUV-10]